MITEAENIILHIFAIIGYTFCLYHLLKYVLEVDIKEIIDNEDKNQSYF